MRLYIIWLFAIESSLANTLYIRYKSEDDRESAKIFCKIFPIIYALFLPMK